MNKALAIAGSLESNDILISISTGSGKNTIALESIVMKQFGPAIMETIEASLKQFNIEAVQIEAKDKGALECTIKARMEAAIMRYKEAIAKN